MGLLETHTAKGYDGRPRFYSQPQFPAERIQHIPGHHWTAVSDHPAYVHRIMAERTLAHHRDPSLDNLLYPQENLVG
jgi:hypothetical protein